MLGQNSSAVGGTMRAYQTAVTYLRAFLSADEHYSFSRAYEGSAWGRFARWLIVGAYGTVGVLFLLVILLNPYGNFPKTALSQVFADNNQRYSYPSIVRSGNYQSAVFGTSTSRLLAPSELEREFGGRFANLSMDASTAWEQTQIAKLFLDHVEQPKTVILSIDGMVWCNPSADQQRVTFRLFPHSFYDENPFNDFADILNLELWDAIRKSVKVALGAREPYQDASGFGDFTPGEENYDAQKAHQHIYADPFSQPDATLLTSSELASVTFPALDWLNDILSRIPPNTTTIIARMPIHVAAQAGQGTRAEQSERECFRRIEAIASAHNVAIYDMSFPSEITSNDQNYWDRLHYRMPIGSRVVTEIGRALRTGEPSPTLKIISPKN